LNLIKRVASSIAENRVALVLLQWPAGQGEVRTWYKGMRGGQTRMLVLGQLSAAASPDTPKDMIPRLTSANAELKPPVSIYRGEGSIRLDKI